MIAISLDGHIGPLQLARSRPPAIISFAGTPDVRAPGRLGYDCVPQERGLRWRVRREYCRTVFFVNPRTGRLGDVFTSSPQYVLAPLHAGSSTEAAEHRLNRRAYGGCSNTIYAAGAKTELTVVIDGAARRPSGHLVGGHVAAFVLHSKTDGVDAFDCW